MATNREGEESGDALRREVERAREACLRLLDYRARSRAELRERLRRKGFAEVAAERAIAELEAAGLVDDESFARAWVRERVERSLRGAIAVRVELRRKGVEDQIIKRALAREMTGGQELAAALRAAERYAPRSGEDAVAGRRRLAQALRRRGFSGEAIEAVFARRRNEEE